LSSETMGRPLLDCDAVCRALWPDPEAAAGTTAWAHYEICPCCRMFFVRDRRLAERLATVRMRPASTGLRLRVALTLRLSF
jgi:hypothetical protein